MFNAIGGTAFLVLVAVVWGVAGYYAGRKMAHVPIGTPENESKLQMALSCDDFEVLQRRNRITVTFSPRP